MTFDDRFYVHGSCEECIVCRFGLVPSNAFQRFERDGVTVLLCSRTCAAEFDRSSAFYVARKQIDDLLYSSHTNGKPDV